MMKFKMALSTLALVGCLGATMPAFAQEKPEALGLGIFTFTSGPAAAYGMPGKNAADLMIEQINAAGGIGGVKIAPTYVDEAQGAQGVLRRVTAGGVGQNGVAVRRQRVEQAGLVRVLAEVGSANRDGDDFRPARFNGTACFVEVAILAGADQ